jgi:serine/threonine-protein kinase
MPHGTPAGVTGAGQRTPNEQALANARTAVADGPTTLSAAETLPVAPARGRTAVVVVGVLLAVAVLVGVGAFVLSKPTAEPSGVAATPSADTSVAVTPSAAPSATVTVEPVPSASATPAEPPRVKITVQSTPKSVDVYLGGEKLGTSPDDDIRIERGDEEVELTIKAEGYVSSKIKVKPSADAVVGVKLTRKGGSNKPGYSPLEF